MMTVVSFVTNPNDLGHTSLEEAAREGQLEMLQTLLELGANVNLESAKGYTPPTWPVTEIASTPPLRSVKPDRAPTRCGAVLHRST